MALIRTLLFIPLSAGLASAAEVRVMCREIAEIYSIEIEQDERVQLTVYLKSSGDPLDGYKVELYSFPLQRTARPLAEQRSNIHGTVTFRDLPPGSYHVQMKPEEKPVLTVEIGDMRLKKQ